MWSLIRALADVISRSRKADSCGVGKTYDSVFDVERPMQQRPDDRLTQGPDCNDEVHQSVVCRRTIVVDYKGQGEKPGFEVMF